jgi:hypothetical protein
MVFIMYVKVPDPSLTMSADGRRAPEYELFALTHRSVRDVFALRKSRGLSG